MAALPGFGILLRPGTVNSSFLKVTRFDAGKNINKLSQVITYAMIISVFFVFNLPLPAHPSCMRCSLFCWRHSKLSVVWLFFVLLVAPGLLINEI
jgi:hypothetical protein